MFKFGYGEDMVKYKKYMVITAAVVAVFVLTAVCFGVFRIRNVVEDAGSAEIRLIEVNENGRLQALTDLGAYNEDEILAVLSEGKMRLSFDCTDTYPQGSVLYSIHFYDGGISKTILLGNINQVTHSGHKIGFRVTNSEELIGLLQDAIG